MTEREFRRLVLAAARAARRQWRKSDTAGEKLERWLDREINRKTRIRAEQALAVIPLWEAFRDQVKGVERAIADFIATASI